MLNVGRNVVDDVGLNKISQGERSHLLYSSRSPLVGLIDEL